MAIRFRKSFTLAPGVRMFLSPRGISGSFGPRGSSISVGRHGVHSNFGLPGTGLSMRSKLSVGHSHAQARASGAGNRMELPLTVGIGDDGVLFFHDHDGDPVPEHLVAIAKKQQGDAIRDLIQRKCDEINQQVEAVGELHLGTPSPERSPVFTPKDYGELRPTPPVLSVPGFWDKLFTSRRDRIETDNTAAQTRYRSELAAWEAGLAAHREAQEHKRTFIQVEIYRDPIAMEAHFEATLQAIAWPRETLVAFELMDAGRVVFIDVDLPEIEDMPDRTAGVPQRGMRLSVKAMSSTQIQKLYMRHVHAVGFRIVGEAFAALPRVDQVVLSGYTQRRDAATGQLGDEYLYSARMNRSDWSRIDFSGLDSIDVVNALERFDLRRDMTKTGRFRPVMPFTAI